MSKAVKAESSELFENTPILQTIIKLALPTVFGQIILVLYNMADTFFIGLTGDDAKITAVTVCMPAFMFLSAISNLFGVGGSSATARALGWKAPERARRASAFSFWGCVAVTLLYSVGAFVLGDLFVDLLGGSAPEVHAYAKEYLITTVVIGGFGTAINTLLAHLVRSEGRSLEASSGIMLGGILNILLDPLFMFVLLPTGKETLGAAVATTLSNYVSMAYFFVIIYKNRSRSELNYHLCAECFRDGIPGEILSTGLPACLMTLCENISYVILDNLMSGYGMACQAGLGVAKKINMLAHSIVRGISQGVLPLIAYNYASGNYKRMKNSVLLSTSFSVLFSGICMVAFLVFGRTLVGFFISNGTDSVSDGVRFLSILCLGCPFSACAYAFISFFQAVGKSFRSFILAILRKGILDIPLMFVLNSFWPQSGIVAATPIADMVCCAVAIFLFTHFLRYSECAASSQIEGTGV